MPTIHFTHKTIDDLPTPDKSKVDYYDDKTPGFWLRVSPSGAKEFYAVARLGKGSGKKIKVKIGPFPFHGGLDEARKRAAAALNGIRDGVDPGQKKAEKEAAAVTLRAVFDKMLEVRGGKLKPKTVKTYSDLFRTYLADWLDKPLRKIGKKDVEARHKKITDKGTVAAANNTFRTLRLVWNFGNVYFEGALGENPVKHLSGLRLWNRVQPKKREIPRHKLKAWYEAVEELDNPILRDFLLMLIFTGLRRNEAAKLKWADVDLEARTFTIRETKNHEPLQLPISSWLYEIFLRRLDARENEFVFPGTGASGRLEEPKRAVKAVSEKSGTPFSCHDLRRTFTTAGVEMLIHPFILDALTNHIGGKKDMTRDYTVINVERLRGPAQQIADFFASSLGIKEPAKIIHLPLGKTA